MATPFEPDTFRLDLSTASKNAFDETWASYQKEREERIREDTRPPFPFDNDGWYDITPEMSAAALMYSSGNRQLAYQTVKTFAADMVANDWPATGEAICVSEGKLGEGHHRLVASMMSGATFRSYVVTSVPKIANSFAYYNAGKRRTPADALYIAGWNGAGPVMATVVGQLAMRYDANALGVQKQPRFRPPNARETLSYLVAHPDLQNAARLILGTYPEAVSVIQSKPAAVMFAWLVIRAYGQAALGEFCRPLGTGAMLTEDSPILAARNKLLAPEVPPASKMAARTRLAYVNKAFLMHMRGELMGRERDKNTKAMVVLPLTVDLEEAFPRIEKPIVIAEAAE